MEALRRAAAGLPSVIRRQTEVRMLDALFLAGIVALFAGCALTVLACERI
jgi:hypothetical protein